MLLRRVLVPALSLGLAVLSFAADKNPAKLLTYTGEVLDSQCALHVHSVEGTHQGVMNKMGGTKESCTNACVKDMGGKYVFLEDRNNVVFRLEQQGKAAPFAGKKVKITGIAAKDGKTLNVANIEPLQ